MKKSRLTKAQKDVLEHLKTDRLYCDGDDPIWLNGGRPPQFKTLRRLEDLGLVAFFACGIPVDGLRDFRYEVVLVE